MRYEIVSFIKKENKMNTPEDRGNRIAAWTARSRDVLWIISLGIITHLIIITIIASGWTAANLALTVFLVFTTILTITGALDAMDDINAISKDAQANEKDLHGQKRFEETQWGMFKGLVILGLGLTAVAELYLMWIA